jgi:uncharacterized membrane protein YgdD (TMEM256/DUF423 family)
MKARLICVAATLSLATATALGAFGTHALRPILTPERFASFDIAVTYQFFHSLGLLGIGFLQHQDPTNHAFGRIAKALLLGMLLFCGSIYALTFGAPKGVAMFAPIGGGTLILTWVFAAISIWRSRALTD